MNKLIISFPNKRRFWQLLFFFAVIVVFCIISVENNAPAEGFTIYSVICVITFVVNISISIFQYIRAVKKHSFSLSGMFWLFGIVFLGIAPFVQYLSGWHPWKLLTNDRELINDNLLILLWYFSFIIGSHNRFKFVIGTRRRSEESNQAISHQGVIIAVITTILFSIYLFATNGLSGLFFRGLRSARVSLGSAMSLLTYHVLRNAILYNFVILLQGVKSNGKYKTSCIVCGVLFLLTCFPTGLSRYMAGAFYLGTYIHLREKKRCGVGFAILVFLGLTLAFPVFSLFRRMTGVSSFSGFASQAKEAIVSGFLTANYDAHNMIVSAMHYTESFGYSWGRQLFGAMLFFVPRSIWPNKPIGSGAEVISALRQYSFTNISMPLVGEAFINFGIVGVVLIGILVGTISKRIDKKYWENDSNLSVLNTVYPFLVFYFFFLQRGDLMSSGAYLIANAVMGLLCLKVLTKKVNLEEKPYVEPLC